MLLSANSNMAPVENIAARLVSNWTTHALFCFSMEYIEMRMLRQRWIWNKAFINIWENFIRCFICYCPVLVCASRDYRTSVVEALPTFRVSK